MARPAVELRLGEICAGLAQDLVGLAQLAVLALQGVQLGGHVGGDAGAVAAVGLRLLDPLVQRLRRTADPGRDREDRLPARWVIALTLQQEPHCARPDLGTAIAGGLVRGAPTFSGMGAFDKPGAVQARRTALSRRRTSPTTSRASGTGRPPRLRPRAPSAPDDLFLAEPASLHVRRLLLGRILAPFGGERGGPVRADRTRFEHARSKRERRAWGRRSSVCAVRKIWLRG